MKKILQKIFPKKFGSFWKKVRKNKKFETLAQKLGFLSGPGGVSTSEALSAPERQRRAMSAADGPMAIYVETSAALRQGPKIYIAQPRLIGVRGPLGNI